MSRVIYKYATLESAINIIKTRAVVLNSPDKFNDPFDSKLDINDKEIKHSIQLVENYLLFKTLSYIVENNNIPMNCFQKLIFGVLKKEIQFTRKLIQKDKRYTKMPMFNLVINVFSSLNEEFANIVKTSEAKFKDEIAPSIFEMRKKARISCFSKRKDSILMWSHYADSHRGVCLEIEENRSFFKDVIYTNEKHGLDLMHATARVLAGDFVGNPIDYSDKKFSEKMLAPFFYKSKDWSYEEEVRCVLSDKEDNVDGYYFDDGRTLLKIKIKRILVGSRANSDKLQELFRLANNRNIPIVYMKESNDSYSIVEDFDRTFKIIKKRKVEKNRVESLIDEVDHCLDNGNYLGALSIALILPGIFGSINYPEMTYRDAYIKWYDDYIGQYNDSSTKFEKKIPYIDGEFCYEVKESLHNHGLISKTFQTKRYNITKITFRVERKKFFEIYTGGSCLGTDFDGTLKSEVDLNVRQFWIQLKSLAEYELRVNKKAIDELPINIVEDYDLVIDDLRELDVLNRGHD